jgi:CheY-like chemotaxis protein
VKRDDDYLRQLLLEFEAQPDCLVLIVSHMSMSHEERKRQYHVQLLCDAGLMAPVKNATFRMTMQGHDYLDAIRQDGIWEKTKNAVAETGGSASLEIVKALAMGFLKKKIEQHTGMAL